MSDELQITSSKLFSSVLPILDILLMAEQAQSDADDLDGLQEVPLDATQDQTDPSTNPPYAKLIQELQQPDTPPRPPPEDGKPKLKIQPERAKLLQNLLNAIPIASAS